MVCRLNIDTRIYKNDLRRHREEIGLMETGLLAHTPNVSGMQLSNYECHGGKHVGLK